MDLTQNYFEIFGLPVSFAVEQSLLKQQYRDLQIRFHPDKFANNSSHEQRLAEQFSALINTAYQTLSSPLMTAEYLLQLSGHTVDNENLTINDGSFLFKQMQWREALAEMDLSQVAKAESSIAELQQAVVDEREQLKGRFVDHFSSDRISDCIQIIAKWHFVEKMQLEIERLEDKLFDAAY